MNLDAMIEGNRRRKEGMNNTNFPASTLFSDTEQGAVQLPDAIF